MLITISGQATFFISDDLGNIREGTEQGLYHEDSRFLSTYDLTLDGQPPVLLTARQTTPSSSIHFLTNPVLSGVPRGEIGVVRRRSVAENMREEIDLLNYGEAETQFELALRFDADFCHVFEAKHEVQVSAESIRRGGTYTHSQAEGGRLQRLRYDSSLRTREVVLRFSRMPSHIDEACHFALRLAPHASWRLVVEVQPLKNEYVGLPVLLEDDDQAPPRGLRADDQRHHRGRRHLVAQAPRLETDTLMLRRAYEQSVMDFAALHVSGHQAGIDDDVIAAGIPWFKTLFGRDALITAYQALPFFPDSARGTLRALARLQGTQHDRVRVEEPGKILHEWRSPTFTGTQRNPALFPYYGTIDATPLFLVVLASHFEVTRDLAFQEEMRESALRALDWMEQYGDRDGDGYLEYIKEAEWGLDNQGWKDSGDALRFADGRLAQPPIALCEVQGYAYAARVGMARVWEALGDDAGAARLREQAALLKERFNRDFWLPDQQYYAFALDGQKRHVDALVSNPGHLLWSGIADEDKAAAVARRLLSDELFSGWGIRTMGRAEGGYNPMSYHCGSVWPHDNSLIAAGLARYGYTREAGQVIAGLLRALEFSPDYRLPELFAGFGVDEAPFPVEYPTACRPQAWAAGSVFLLLATLMRIDVSASANSDAPLMVYGVNRVRLRGIWLNGRQTDVELQVCLDQDD